MRSAELIFGLEDNPPPATAAFAGLQHLLAIFGGILTAPLIIASGMGLSAEDTNYLVTSALLISGVATFIQVKRFGPIGSGLLSIQGTSFTFIGPILFAWFHLPEYLDDTEKLGILFGTCAIASVVMIALGYHIRRICKVITPTVAGATVILLGSALVWSTLKTISFEINRNGAVVLLQVALVLGITLFMASRKNPWMRLSSIVAGLATGYLVSIALGLVDFSLLKKLDPVFVPQPGKFSFGFDWGVFLILMPVFIVSATESIGDLTATSALSKLPTSGEEYRLRLRGGVMGDALNSFIASLFATFPNTTFSQNNGVIQLTGIASRQVGFYVAGFLVILGCFPVVGGLFQVMPGGVLYGATLLMFTLVGLAGVRIINTSSPTNRSWTIAISAVLGGWIVSQSAVYWHSLPDALSMMIQFPVSTGALIAIILEGCLPKSASQTRAIKT